MSEYDVDLLLARSMPITTGERVSGAAMRMKSIFFTVLGSGIMAEERTTLFRGLVLAYDRDDQKTDRRAVYMMICSIIDAELTVSQTNISIFYTSPSSYPDACPGPRTTLALIV